MHHTAKPGAKGRGHPLRTASGKRASSDVEDTGAGCDGEHEGCGEEQGKVG